VSALAYSIGSPPVRILAGLDYVRR